MAKVETDHQEVGEVLGCVYQGTPGKRDCILFVIGLSDGTIVVRDVRDCKYIPEKLDKES